jgi:hypothetical protein
MRSSSNQPLRPPAPSILDLAASARHQPRLVDVLASWACTGASLGRLASSWSLHAVRGPASSSAPPTHPGRTPRRTWPLRVRRPPPPPVKSHVMRGSSASTSTTRTTRPRRFRMEARARAERSASTGVGTSWISATAFRRGALQEQRVPVRRSGRRTGPMAANVRATAPSIATR